MALVNRVLEARWPEDDLLVFDPFESQVPAAPRCAVREDPEAAEELRDCSAILGATHPAS